MKAFTLAAVLAANILGVAALDTLAGYTADIPKCAYAEFKKAMESENCEVDDVDASSFECLCKHYTAIAATVGQNLDDTQCTLGKIPLQPFLSARLDGAEIRADFAQAMGSACGIWMLDGTTASELALATSLLGEELDGNSPSTASGSSATSAESSAGTATAAASSSTNVAAVPTAGTGVAGVIGGAAALAALLL
ncbi:hypothetical protein AK830_g9655 [Neonectria ditissima]|uniref:Extracellular membrane protein CFEM domain-containing protein n=1 Tax=Neonectria ditissima TaxID=78410 RepID=A0A0P7AUA0_9HYPO|nr:hypothetical protein AK830_g9655 [Neonectria ditissima]